MSQENVRLVKRAFEALKRDGLEAALSYFHQDIEWLVPEWMEGETFQGRDGLRRAYGLMDDVFAHYRLDLEKIIDCSSDHVVALLYQRGSIKGTDSEI